MIGSSGYSGHLLEKELFSVPDVEKSENERDRLFRGVRVNFRRFFEKNIKNIQTYKDPSDPDPRFANDLHATVAEKLGLDDYGKLRIYSAVNTYMDRAMGVDAIMEYEISDGITVLVSLDVTKNTAKGEEHKADVVFQWPNEGLDPKDEDDKEEWIERINQIAERILKVLNYYKEKNQTKIRSKYVT